MHQIAQEAGKPESYRATMVGAWFGTPAVQVDDPYFDGAGPARAGCTFCGGCMVGCRHNAKNTLPKNYLYLAEQKGLHVLTESVVENVIPLPTGNYQIRYRSSTGGFSSGQVEAAKVIFSAGVMGTIKLLLSLRDIQKSLPNLSGRLGDSVRTNSEALLGGLAKNDSINYSEGVSISSIIDTDDVTRVEPVRYPAGSDLMRMISAPLVDLEAGIATRMFHSIRWLIRHPADAMRAFVLPGWAKKVTILLIMQHADNRMNFRIGRNWLTLWRRGLVSREVAGHKIHAQVKGSHAVARAFAQKIGGVPLGSMGENLLNLPTTAHILGGAPMGQTAADSVISPNFEIHNYPGLFIIDGSTMPANPGVNPSLTITAMAEYAMSMVSEKDLN